MPYICIEFYSWQVFLYFERYKVLVNLLAQSDLGGVISITLPINKNGQNYYIDFNLLKYNNLN